MIRRTDRKRLTVSLLKLFLVAGAIFGGFHLLFDVPFAPRHEIRAGDINPPTLDQSREPGPRIIFRLDDIEQGVRTEQVMAILSVFVQAGVPLELGIIPYVNERPSFALPRLKSYVSRGAADISVHGFTHRPNEFDTTKSKLPRDALRRGLLKATSRIQDYYGVYPVAFLVPYDVFDEPGYEAVRAAGFRIFSSQWQTDDHRGTRPVDFEGRPAEGGLHRLPSVDDAVTWNAGRQSWGGFQPLSNLLYSVRSSLETLEVAVLSLHPAAFEDTGGGVDAGKLNELAHLIERTRELGMITTFRNWYCARPGGDDPRLCPPTTRP